MKRFKYIYIDKKKDKLIISGDSDSVDFIEHFLTACLSMPDIGAAYRSYQEFRNGSYNKKKQ